MQKAASVHHRNSCWFLCCRSKLCKHPQCAAGRQFKNSSRRIRSEGVAAGASPAFHAAPLWLPDPQPRFLGPGRNRMRPLQARHSGWLVPDVQPPVPRRKWRSLSAKSRNKAWAVLCALPRGWGHGHTHARAHSAQLPKAAATRPAGLDHPRLGGRPQHLPMRITS